MNAQPWWFLAAGIVLALAFAIAGVIIVAAAGLRIKRRVDALKKAPLPANLPEAQAYFDRINADLEQMTALLERAKAAIESINESLRTMRIPQAVLALRTASAAVRLLLARS